MAKKSMVLKQQAKPKFSVRAYNRCKICGRPHAYLRDYGVCRICFRELAYKGPDPGRSQGILVKTLPKERLYGGAFSSLLLGDAVPLRYAQFRRNRGDISPHGGRGRAAAARAAV